MEDLKNMTVSYSAISNTVGISDRSERTTGGTTILSYDWYIGDWYPYWTYFYPNYTYVQKDTFEKAFKVAKMLLAEKILKSRKLSDFIELVEMIAKEL